MKNSKALFVARAGVIAALYVVLTVISNSVGLASGVIQVRLSEALCVLPIFFPEAIFGLFTGCLISNTVCGCAVLDIVFGSLATLIGAIGTYFLRKNKYLAMLSPVISNILIIPFVLKYVYSLNDAWWYMAVTIGIGEIISCVLFGNGLINILRKYKEISH